MASTKNRRLRKKLCLDEFAVSGSDSLLDQFIEFVEDREICVVGGGNIKSFSAFICSDQRYGSASSEDIDQTKPSISNIVVGPLVDANYGI